MSTDPGPLCAGRTVVLNCTGGQAHGWMYDMSRDVNINVLEEPPTEPVELSGVQFTFSQLSPSPNLITQIIFMSSQEMNGRILTCLSVIDSITIVTGEVTLAISENNSKSSIITIELYSLIGWAEGIVWRHLRRFCVLCRNLSRANQLRVVT